MKFSEIREKIAEDILEIVDHEYVMFDKVQNIGGRADCQDNRPTFYIMRSSQLSAWSEEMRRSYLQDLLEAEAAGRNLLTEKYAYMMEQTNPAEYAQIADRLPARSREKRGRATHSGDDRAWATSFETYLRGELSTYSMKTLSLYEAHVESLRAAGTNMNRAILQKEVELYGYPSLEAAEKAHG